MPEVGRLVPLPIAPPRGKVARMSLTCNIDARGKAVRLRIGIVGLAVGIAMLLGWALPTGGTLPWVIAATTLAGAALSIFEARAGWCVLRAMGFHTRI
jgi:hypothetical protein